MKTIIVLPVFLFLFSCGTETRKPTTTTSSAKLELFSLTFNTKDSLLITRILLNGPSKESKEKTEYLSRASEEELRSFVGEKSKDLLEGLDMEEDLYVHKLKGGAFRIYPTCRHQIRGIDVEFWWEETAENHGKIMFYPDNSMVFYFNLASIAKRYNEISQVESVVSIERFTWLIVEDAVLNIKEVKKEEMFSI